MNKLSEDDVFKQTQELIAGGKYQEVFNLSKSYAETGYVDAKTTLGYLYMNGLGVPKNFKESEYWLTQAANSGAREAVYYLGALSMHEHNNVEALHHFSDAAKLGYVPAICRTGLFYKDGHGAEKNLSLAYDYLKRAAELGNHRAKKEVAMILLGGYEGWQGRVKSIFMLLNTLIQALKESYKNPTSLNFRY